MSHGSTSESSSSSAQSSRQIDEEAATGGSAGRRRKRHVQDVIEGSARVEREPDAAPAPSSDDDPNEALPRRNPVDTENKDDAEADNEAEADAEEAHAGAERTPNDTPVTREELQSMRELHEATARAIARLETAFLAKPRDDVNNKRKRRRKRGSGKGKRRKARRSRSTSETASEEEGEFEEGDDGHIRHSTSAILQEALELLPTDKGWKEICEQARTKLFIRRSNLQLTFYPSSAAKTWAICAVVDNLTPNYASLALVADPNRSFSDWKTSAAGRVRDISLPRIGLFRHERDMKSLWATRSRRTLSRIRDRVSLGDVATDKLAPSRWSCDRNGMLFASDAFTARSAGGVQATNGERDRNTEALPRDMAGARGTSPRSHQGRFSNSAGSNAQIVDGLHVLVKAAVTRTIAEFRPEYDATSQSWAWGCHGLRISADGIAAADAVSVEASASRGTPQA
ncbi:unnamed protein product [Closterium sp. Yama58-4]|nr:unnamed protein product [Closterium sp. Yama58-4]